jgi:hypothetical protein
MRQQCNSCGGQYDKFSADGVRYYHTCSPDEITHATADVEGKPGTPETRKPRANRRDENIPRGLVHMEGKPMLIGGYDADKARRILTPADSVVTLEGDGVTIIAP